jgi:hypothetical protein
VRSLSTFDCGLLGLGCDAVSEEFGLLSPSSRETHPDYRGGTLT